MLKKFNIFKSKLHVHDYLFIAYSGGLDSSALLSSFILDNKFCIEPKVIHIDHSYKTESLEWSVFCRLNCNFYKVILYKFKLSIRYKSNLEASFRYMRLNLFSNIISKNRTLFLAQHQDDLLETILLKFFRGSGFLSFIGLMFESKLLQLNVSRPLLHASKYHLLNYVAIYGLNFILDNSNFDERFSRNYIRKILWPFLSNRWNLDNVILKNRFFLRNNLNYLLIYLNIFKNTYGFNYKALHIGYLSKMSVFLQIEILRYWIIFFGYKSLNYEHLFLAIKNIFFRKLLCFNFGVKSCLLFRYVHYFYISDNMSGCIFFYYLGKYSKKLYFKIYF